LQVSVHDYGCYPPFAEYSFCPEPTSTATLVAAKQVADSLGKPLYVGEYGAPPCVSGGWGDGDCPPYPSALLKYQADTKVQLSTLWTWCATGSTCVDPQLNIGSVWAVTAMQITNQALHHADRKGVIPGKLAGSSDQSWDAQRPTCAGRRNGTYCVGPPIVPVIFPLNHTILTCPDENRSVCPSGYYCGESTGDPPDDAHCRVL
jgi:hypothetical protein